MLLNISSNAVICITLLEYTYLSLNWHILDICMDKAFVKNYFFLKKSRQMQYLHFRASIKVLFLREMLISISEICEFKSIRLKNFIPRTLVIRANERLTNTYLIPKT